VFRIVKRDAPERPAGTGRALLNANGENTKVVQELLRHASLKVTTDIYMQAVSPQKRAAQTKRAWMLLKPASSE
jgi:integrase